MLFNQVAIIGVGLIGGSLGLEIRRKKIAKTVVGFGRSSANLKTALRRKLIHRAAKSLSDAVKDADLILLCTPVQTLIAQLKEVAKAAKPGAIVMDVGSTKAAIVAQAEKILRKQHFVGAHPMAGTENSGAEAAIADLFLKKKCILTPTAKTNSKAIGQAQAFWKKIGSEVLVISPREHDTVIGLVSHLPQMSAYALINTLGLILTETEIKKMSGSGLRDTTRIAASPAAMWLDIVNTNADVLSGALKLYAKEILQMADQIESGSAKKLRGYFTKASELRRKL